MSTDIEILFIVTKTFRATKKVMAPFKVFRTRAAARKYAKDRNAESKRYHYTAIPATWGPEQ